MFIWKQKDGILQCRLSDAKKFQITSIFRFSVLYALCIFLRLREMHHFLVLLQVLTEYILISVTSAVTVTIAGVVKEAVTILV